MNRTTGIIKCCVYDNPRTMARECWQDGKLIVAYSMVTVLQIGQWPPPPKMFHMGANVGDWCTGQLIGDCDEMAEKSAEE